MFCHPDLVQLTKVTLHQYHFLRMLEMDMSTIHVDQRMDTYDRASVADKLLHTLDGFEDQISQRTVFFAVALMDRYYGTLPLAIRRSVNVYLLGATCLHIASKCEDVTYIGIKDLVNQAIVANDGGGYTGNDILGLEETVLNALNFDLFVPTTIDFVNIYTDCVREIVSRRDIALFAKFMAESTLLSSKSLDFPPSLLSAAAVAYSLHCAKVPHFWTDTLRALTQYDIETLKPCMKFMHQLHERSPTSPFKTVADRYKRAVFLNVASWQPVAM
jgi:G2/mitotic-specific cyclin-B, other